MPSIGHVAVGLAAARAASATPRQRILLSVLFGAASLAPDLDVIGFGYGIRYGAPWGHRGASHSLVFALAFAAALTFLTSAFSANLRKSRFRSFLWLAVVIASHGLLDALTDGGRGIALLWPFTNQRFFAPVRPIPVAPIGIRFLSARGLFVAIAELALFAPFFIYGLWPRRRANPRRR
jgi:inner membrane protein